MLFTSIFSLICYKANCQLRGEKRKQMFDLMLMSSCKEKFKMRQILNSSTWLAPNLGAQEERLPRRKRHLSFPTNNSFESITIELYVYMVDINFFGPIFDVISTNGPILLEIEIPEVTISSRY